MTQVNPSNEFECPMCYETHELPKSGDFPVNKKLLGILREQPSEIRRSESIEALKFHLLECQVRVGELRTMLINNGVDKVQAVCQDIRTEVYLETERKIEALHSLSEGLIVKICDFEKECIESLSGKDVEKDFPGDLVSEFNELDAAWKKAIQQAQVCKFHSS